MLYCHDSCRLIPICFLYSYTSASKIHRERAEMLNTQMYHDLQPRRLRSHLFMQVCSLPFAC